MKPTKLHSRPLSPIDHAINQAGIGIVDTVERHYQRYLSKPIEQNAKSYCLWRLRLHMRLRNNRELLEAINRERNLGLNDSTPGRLCWGCEF
jgi:hypothetical protein